MERDDDRVSILIPSLRGGGAERVMLTVARGLSERGLAVDLLVMEISGPYLRDVPGQVTLVDLGVRHASAALPSLIRYLRKVRPKALLSALPHVNVAAVIARTLARTETRLVLSEHNTASILTRKLKQRRGRLLPFFMRLAYTKADALVAVSDGVADDLANLLRIPRTRIERIYNPIVTAEIDELANEPIEHPWFQDEERPVILGAGRLNAQKDFGTLIRAFAHVRAMRECRLLIIGEGEEREELERLAGELNVKADLAMPGFVRNPYKYMKAATLFVLSSRWEGFGNVLVEAMACGTPVVSTDCPNGPKEILAAGAHGLLTPIGDVEALAGAITTQLDSPRGSGLVERAREFSVATGVDQYYRVLGLQRTACNGVDSR